MYAGAPKNFIYHCSKWQNEYDDTELDLTDMLKSMMYHVTKDTLAGEGPVVMFKLDGFVDALRETSLPLLGICLGLQLLFEGSDEGTATGLGLLKGRVRALPRQAGQSVVGVSARAVASSRSGVRIRRDETRFMKGGGGVG